MSVVLVWQGGHVYPHKKLGAEKEFSRLAIIHRGSLSFVGDETVCRWSGQKKVFIQAARCFVSEAFKVDMLPFL